MLRRRRKPAESAGAKHGPRCSPFACYCVVDLTDQHRTVFGQEVGTWMREARAQLPAPIPPPARAESA